MVSGDGPCDGDSGDEHTLKALSWVFGFLLPIRLFRDLIASRGWTVFERIVSEISRLRAMSSLLRSVRSSAAGCDESLQAAASRLLYLLVQGRIGRRRPPAHHLGERGCLGSWEEGSSRSRRRGRSWGDGCRKRKRSLHGRFDAMQNPEVLRWCITARKGGPLVTQSMWWLVMLAELSCLLDDRSVGSLGGVNDGNAG